MPKYPRFSSIINSILESIYEKYSTKIAYHGSNLIKFHYGDTHFQPKYLLPINPEFIRKNPEFNRYCDSFGVNELREALVEKLKNDNMFPVSKKNVMITNSGTNALSLSTIGLVEPDEDVIVITPVWSFVFEIMSFCGANVIEVPLYVKLYEDPEIDINLHMKQFVTKKTVAIYLNTPNNPSGKVLNLKQLEQISKFAREHKLWIISDEAYEGLIYDNNIHHSIGSLSGLFDQTISIFTFSKLYQFAGIRLGYVVGAKEVIQNLNKIMMHQIYSPTTLGQMMMVEPVRTRNEWKEIVKLEYQKLRDYFVQNLEFQFNVPEATFYFFFSIKKYLKERNYDEIIETLLDNAVFVALGKEFGKDFNDYIRICFTIEPIEKQKKGIEVLNSIILNS